MAQLTLYELTTEDGASPSPFVWRTKLALAKKELAYESRPLGFTDIVKQFGGRFRTVPILEDEATQLNESWAIVDHLDTAYPDHPLVISCPAERAMVQFFDNWLVGIFFPQLIWIYTLDIHNRAAPADRLYYRETREKRLGRTLEEAVSDRETRLPVVRLALEPVRATILKQPYLGGDTPNYADMLLLATFVWIATIGTTPLLAADDPLTPWARSGLDAFGDVGRAIDLTSLSQVG